MQFNSAHQRPAIYVRLSRLPTSHLIHHAVFLIASVSTRIYLEAPRTLYFLIECMIHARCQFLDENVYLIVDKTDKLPPSRLHLRQATAAILNRRQKQNP